MKFQLLLGCGSNKNKQVWEQGDTEWGQLTTLDIDPCHNPDIVWDLNQLPWPFQDNTFDEIHAYEVLEHLGTQGDYKAFFAQFSEIHRILTPGGKLFATVPAWNDLWAFGDPSHTRIINEGTLTFLNQEQYQKQVGKSQMSDYRSIYKADFVPRHAEYKGKHFIFILEAVKGPANALAE